MTWRTHVLGGIASLWILAAVPGVTDSNNVASNIGLLASLAALGALLPDLDAHDSKLRHLNLGIGFEPFTLPAHFASGVFTHRGLLHSGMGIGLCAVLFSLPLGVWLGWQAGFALLLGYISHVALDACTRAGVPLRYPNPRKYWLLPKSWRFVTGSVAEDMLLGPLFLVVVTLLLRSLLGLYHTGV